MAYFRALLAAFSLYSTIPMPHFNWDDKATENAICFFPFVGVVLGGIYIAWCHVARAIGTGAVLFAAAAVSLPIFLTGGIHLDGFIDTVDAISSHRDRERRLQIMKDPNCGAFAVIYCGAYLLLCFGAYHELFMQEKEKAAGAVFVISRILSALLAIALPKAKKEGMLAELTKNSVKGSSAVWLIFLLLLCGGAALRLFCLSGAAMLLFMLLTALLYRNAALKLFGGVTGDTAGFFLCSAELTGLFGILAGAWKLF